MPGFSFSADELNVTNVAVAGYYGTEVRNARLWITIVAGVVTSFALLVGRNRRECGVAS